MSVEQPLVSCIMPTRERRAWVPRAIACFLAQDYPHKELVILDDGADAIADLVPPDPQLRYLRSRPGRTLGAKRNDCVAECRGDLIMHWDDDDWMAAHRIRYQVEALLAARGEVCGLRQVLYLDLGAGRPWLYRYPEGQRPWLAGNTLLYTRAFWRRSPFPDVQVASDTYFIWAQSLERSVALPDYTFYVAMIHPGNTSPKPLTHSYWSPWPGDLRQVMGADLDFYQAPVQTSAGPTRSTPGSSDLGTNSTGNARSGTNAAAPAEAPLAAEAHLPAAQSAAHAGPGKARMRIGYVLLNFSPLSETFIRREITALCRRGHRVFVYAQYLNRDPLVEELRESGLQVRQVPFLSNPAALAHAAREDGIEHFHSCLMLAAQRAAYGAAQALGTPFTLTAYSGHDIFTANDPHLYEAISADPLCAAIIAEDPFMRDWLVDRLGARADKIRIIPNGFDLDTYRLSAPRPERERVVILAIARFIEKKGLIHLVNAFQRLSGRQDSAELWLVGAGPEEGRLRAAAGQNARIRFLGAMREAQTRACYADADIFCLPCVRTARGDADGVPTTVLEAMAFELPVVSSDLLSMSHYVHDGEAGLLVPPGDEAALAEALDRLCTDAGLRRALGTAGRARVTELCDLRRNVDRLETIMVEFRWRRWSECLDALVERRKHYTGETLAFYTTHRTRAVDFFQPHGRLLDVGCGQGAIRAHLPPDVTYFGCDPLAPDQGGHDFPFACAAGEALPFPSQHFDSVLFYSVVCNMFSVDAALAEAERVLKPGGQLYLHETVDDPNPIHLNRLTSGDLRARVAGRFTITGARPDGAQYLLLRAVKPGGPPPVGQVARPSAIVQQAPAPAAAQEGRPLVTIAIATYNRAHFLRPCIDSVLRQTYHPVEVVVVDDGSTDDSRRVLESYGTAIRVTYHPQNQGIARAKNDALIMAASHARYIGILDSDDYYHPQFVERCVARLEQNPGVGLVYTDDILVDSTGRELGRQPSVEPWDLQAWLRTCNLRGDTWLARRDLVMQTALHDEALRLDVDYDLFYQLLQITTFAHLPEFLVYTRRHEQQSTRNQLELAKCHAANLVKYGYSSEYAYLRARHHPEWVPAIEEGIALGNRLRAQREQSA